MKIYKSITTLANALNKNVCEVEQSYERWIGRNYMYVGEVEIKIHIKDNEINYILVDENSHEDCREYMMAYEINEYNWKVYVDDIEGWQDCKVISIANNKMGINRVTVVCPSGTQLNRVAKFVTDESEIKANGYVYYMEK